MRTLCLISARNLGDAVIHADVLTRLIASGFADRYVVWTFPQAAFLFEGLAACVIYTSAFPMGATVKAFMPRGVPSFLKALRQVRREQPTDTLDLIGDIRERIVCRLLGASQHHGPRWPDGHPFLKHIRRSPFAEAGLTAIPPDARHIYAAHRILLEAMLAGRAAAPNRLPPMRRPVRRIGIHPFASLPCKLWPQPHWEALLRELHRRHPQVHLVLFGAPADRPALQGLGARTGVPAELSTSSLPEFKARLGEVDLLLGLDSFSVHLAHSLGVPSIALIGPNDPALFTPPSTTALTHTGLCPHQPCNGKPRCMGTSIEYVCMSAIAPAEVGAQVALALDGSPLEPPVSHPLRE